jgi:hypothetical protein
VFVYLLALHESTYLTKVKSYISQQDQVCCRHQGRLRSRIYRKRSAKEKENGRKQVLASMVPSPGADTNWIKVALQEKSKQSPVTTMMQQVHNQYQTNVATKTAEAKTTNASKKRKAKPKKAKEKDTRRPAETVLQDTSNTPEVAEETALRLCGCRHGDLSEVKFCKGNGYVLQPSKQVHGGQVLLRLSAGGDKHGK